jgi:type I restriction enzyme S subunit
VVEDGDLGFGRVASIGKVVQLDPTFLPFAVSPTLAILKPKAIDAGYLRQYLLCPDITKQIGKLLTGTTRSSLGIELLRKMRISAPQQPEQRKIAAILSSVDAAIQETDAIIAQTEQVKRGLMQALLTRGIGHTEFRETPIGVIPKEWKAAKLGDVVEIFDSKRVPINDEDRKSIKGEYPYCGANGVLDHINDYIFDGEYILIAEDGGYWNKFEDSAYIMTGKFWVNNHAHILRAVNGIADNRFLMNLINYYDITPYINGSTRGKLNQEDLKLIKIPLAPFSEQRKIAAILSSVNERLVAEREHRSRLETVKKGLMQNLLTGKKRVKGDDYE